MVFPVPNHYTCHLYHMAKLKFQNHTFTLEPYESVLDCLLRNAQTIPYACKAGTCQACLIRTIACEATAESKKWIKHSLQDKGYTLACQWLPEQDVHAALPTIEEFSVAVLISELVMLNKSVMRVKLDVKDPAEMFHYRPGQYLSLINPDGIIRSYSIANSYEKDQFIELHIANTEHGIFTQWLFKSAVVGMKIHIRGPSGTCFYNDAIEKDQALVMAGTGTGLAPLYGIARDALTHGHSGPITFYHGGRSDAHLYYREQLLALQHEFPLFDYRPCTIDASSDPAVLTGRLEQIVEAQLDSSHLQKMRFFLCGAPTFVFDMRKRIYLKGARADNIICDPFTERNVTPT